MAGGFEFEVSHEKSLTSPTFPESSPVIVTDSGATAMKKKILLSFLKVKTIFGYSISLMAAL